TLHAGAGWATNVELTWDSGDGHTAVGQTITHTYPALGVYTATVTATNGVNQATAVTTVTVKPALQYLPLVFTSGTPITPTSSADPLAPLVDQLITVITLTNSRPLYVGEPVAVTATLKTGTNISYTWDFGAGGDVITSTLDVYGAGDTAVYTYTQRGTYTVTLVAENSVSTVTRTLPLTITDVPLNTPIISDTFSSAALPSAWQTFKLTPLGAGWVVTDKQVRSEPYALFHNDDATNQDSWLVTPSLTPMKGSELIFWQYQNYAPEIGKHSVWVSTASPDPKDGDFIELAELPAGEEDMWSQVTIDLSGYAGETIAIGFRYEGDFADEWTIDDVMVTANVQVENDSPTTWGNATVFTATAGLATNVSYSWDFGDGNTAHSSHQNVISYTYALPGTYTTTVTARNGGGSVAVTTTVTVEAVLYLPVVFRDGLMASPPPLAYSRQRGAGEKGASKRRLSGDMG
ncbi:MAG: PKD domain-containing protein, partial [Anaerolineales bacterium]|nr:PKD domain-containing protein [Anaerolineales bacterium]